MTGWAGLREVEQALKGSRVEKPTKRPGVCSQHPEQQGAHETLGAHGRGLTWEDCVGTPSSRRMECQETEPVTGWVDSGFYSRQTSGALPREPGFLTGTVRDFRQVIPLSAVFREESFGNVPEQEGQVLKRVWGLSAGQYMFIKIP